MSYTPRPIAQIEAQIDNAVSSFPLLGPIAANISNVSIFTNWIYVIAFAINALEQLWAILQDELETIIAQGVPGTAPWIQARTLAFEYGNTIVINTDFTVSYVTPNTALQVVEQCAVIISNGTAIVKVTGVAGPLDGSPGTSGPECVALTTYLNTICPLVPIQLINALADILQVNATIYYNGQSNVGIQALVIAALAAYMAALPFNGTVKLSDIEKVILAVPGVVDVTFSQVTATPNGGTPVNLVLANTVMSREYPAYAGYIVNDPANLFANTLTFVVSQN